MKSHAIFLRRQSSESQFGKESVRFSRAEEACKILEINSPLSPCASCASIRRVLRALNFSGGPD